MKKIVITLFLSILSLTNLYSQEKIRACLEFKLGSILVREKPDASKWFVYSEFNEKSRFIMFDSISTTVSYAQIPGNIVIKDMESASNMVFFCGYLHDTVANVRKGIIGRIYLYFPSAVTAEYMIVDDVESVDKMDRYSTSGTLHLVAVGKGYDGAGYAIEALESPSNFTGWEIVKGRYSIISLDMHDIAVTSDHVVISAQSPFDSTGYVCFFTRPPYNLAFGIHTYLSYTSTVKTLPCNSSSQILLAHTSDDTVFSVHYTNNPNQMIFSQYNGTSCLWRRKIVTNSYFPLMQRSINLIDARKDGNASVLNVLVHAIERMNNQQTFKSEVWHITSTGMALGGSILTHLLSNEELRSIDYETSSPTGLVAVGQSAVHGGLMAYHIISDTWGSCTQSSSLTLDRFFGFQETSVERSMETTMVSASMVSVNCSTGTVPLITHCE